MKLIIHIFFIILSVMPSLYFGQNVRCGLPNSVELGSYDIQHYIPPQYARSGLGVGGDIDTGYLVLSTASISSITVTIQNAVYFNNPSSSNALNYSVSLSSTSPLIINLSKTPYGNAGYNTRNIISGNLAGNIDSTQGLILQSSQPFYATIRHRSGAQANYLISKGRLSLGKRFRSGHIYNNSNVPNVKSEHISVMATENNTVVNITDLPGGMSFVNSPTFPVTLNRFESFTLAALQDASSNNTLVNQLNGALITANKNVSVVSGSFLGGGEGSGRDIGIDQTIPTDYLGKSYFLVRGDGSINMEVPMVVADYDTTQIYLNGSSTPTATINAGQHHMIFNQWGTDSTMIINTSKPVYVYQSNGANNSNGNGFMLLAPLNLNIENQKLVIALPNQIGSSIFYIVTTSNATLTLNGVTQTGARPFISNPNFVYYKIAGTTATALLECTAPYFCTNTILSGARGAAGSYTGFPNSFAIRDNIQVEVGNSDTSNFLNNDLINLYNFKLDTICVYPKRGSIQILSNGKVVYTPNNNAVGCDTLIYSIRDSANNIYDQNYVIYCLKLNLLIDSFENIACSGKKKGFIKVKADGGTPSYFYSIKTKKNYGSADTFLSNAVFNNLPPDTFIIKVIDANGNTDTVHKIIRVLNDTSRKDSFRIICSNETVTFNGNSINKSGIYKDTFLNSNGCDSFLYLHLTVNDTSRKDSFRTICKNQPIVFNGLSLNTTGVYKDTLANYLGCDSFFYLHLSVNDTTKVENYITICKNQSVNFNGQNLNITGLYKDTLVNGKGCDSFVYLYLSVMDTTRKDSFRTICKNQPIVFNGQTLNTTGIYRDTFVNSMGCDSLLVLNLTVLDTSNYFFTKNICQGDSFIFKGVKYYSSGNYKDTLTNSKGCDSFVYLNLKVEPLPEADAGIDQTRILCDGDSVLLGKAQVSGNIYAWSPSSGIDRSDIARPWCKATLNTLYSLKVTNILSGCVNKDSVIISVKKDDLEIDYKSSINLKCANIPTGQIDIKAKNGNPGYKYMLSPAIFNNSGVFSNLSAGFYKLTIHDARSCIITDTITIKEPPPIRLNQVITKNLRCYKSKDGEIHLNVKGGTGNYTYFWSPINGSLESLVNLDSGKYNVAIQDSNNCIYRDSFNLTQPSPIIVKDTIIKNNPCYGDSLASIDIRISGGSGGYIYIWSNGKTSPIISNLTQGSYFVTVTDRMQCRDSFSLKITDTYMPLEFESINPSVINCNGLGSIYVKAKGGNPYYLYSIDAGQSFSPNNNFRVSQARIYQLEVKDQNNCLKKEKVLVKDKERIEIEIKPRDTTIKLGEPITLEFKYTKGDTSNIQSYQWKPSEGLNCSDCRMPTVTAYSPTLYSIEVKYDSICTAKAYAKIQYLQDELFIPNSLAPASDIPENRILRIYSNNVFQAKLKIFKRTGEKVYESDQAHNIPWDGIYKGELLPGGTYIYWAEIIYLDGRKVFKNGDITLLR